MDVLKEIASTLRSTDSMAEAFANRVREKIGQDVPDILILEVLKKLNPRSIEINRVVTEVKTTLNKQSRRSGSRSSKAQVVTSSKKSLPTRRIATKVSKSFSTGSSKSSSSASKTMVEQIESILKNNWNRAEKEGLKPSRLGVKDFIDGVHRHTDPRDATRPKILRACKAIDSRDVLITPTLVADTIRERD